MTYKEGRQRVAEWEPPETLPTAARSEVLAGQSILQVHCKLQLAQSGRESLCSEKRPLFDCWESTGGPGLCAEGRQEVVLLRPKRQHSKQPTGLADSLFYVNYCFGVPLLNGQRARL
jgi:hypothetical protein